MDLINCKPIKQLNYVPNHNKRNHKQKKLNFERKVVNKVLRNVHDVRPKILVRVNSDKANNIDSYMKQKMKAQDSIPTTKNEKRLISMQNDNLNDDRSILCSQGQASQRSNLQPIKFPMQDDLKESMSSEILASGNAQRRWLDQRHKRQCNNNARQSEISPFGK